MVGENKLIATNITRIYKDKKANQVLALDHFNISIKKGEIVSLVGPSGCGKSTFLRLVAGLDFPQKGTIIYNEKNITAPNYERGFVFQDANLFPWLSIYDNIAFGLRSRGIYSESKHKIQEYIELMGLSGFEKSYPHQISGGMASRASLARTFIQNPSLILLDEPLAALDALTKINLQEEIIKIWLKSKPIIILVTHDIEEAIYLSDRVIVMSPRPGKVIKEFSIDLIRPRDRMGKKFVGLRREIMELLQ